MGKLVHKFTKTLESLARWSSRGRKNHPLKWLMAQSVFLGLPPSFLGYWAFCIKVPTLPFATELTAFFSDQMFLPMILAGWPVLANPLFQGAITWMDKFSKLGGAGDKRDLYFVIAESANTVVRKKLAKIGKELKKGTELTHENVVKNFFDPEGQVDHLCNSLVSALGTFVEGGLEVVVAKMEDGKTVQWLASSRNHPEEILLNNAKTLFAHTAHKKRKPLVLEDIAEHLRRTSQKPKDRLYFPLDEGESGVDEGSVICYPIFNNHLNKVLACVSIKSDQPYAIEKSFDKKYGAILKSVLLRIELEVAHLYIKENANVAGS